MIFLQLIWIISICFGIVISTETDRNRKKRIFIASDHRGYEFKNKIISLVMDNLPGVDIEDMGPYNTEATDYTLKASAVVGKISQYQLKSVDRGENPLPAYFEDVYGILICMDGIGMDIAGNVFGFPRKIFTANCRTIEDAVTAREHNDARILALGSQTSESLILEMIRGFITTRFSYETDPKLNERHVKRISNITKFINSYLKNKLDVDTKELGSNCSSTAAGFVPVEPDTNVTPSYRSNHDGFLKKMYKDIREQFSLTWTRAELLIKPMIDLSEHDGPYSCSGVKGSCSKYAKWRPNRDEVGENRVTSFRLAILAFWTRIVGINDYDTAENDKEYLRTCKQIDVDAFRNLFIANIQPFLIKNWKLYDSCKDLPQEKINLMFLNQLRVRYSHSLSMLKSSFGSKAFFGRFTEDSEEIEKLENEHLPYIAFMAEEILYPIISYTDHGFLCYAYLNQRIILSTEYDKLLYDTHISFTLAIHRALILLKLADINSIPESIPEEKQCSRFYYRTLTLPGEKNSFDPYQLRLSLQNTSFSTHPIGAMLVFQTVWCIRLRDNPNLVRTMIINPTDPRLSRVAGLSKHPSEFEVIVPSFSEYIISVDPNVIHDNAVGWTEMIEMFKELMNLKDKDNKFKKIFRNCAVLVEIEDVLHSELEHEEKRNWKRRNVSNYAKTAKCMYETISNLASKDGVGLASAFIPEISIVNQLKTDPTIKATKKYKKLLEIFKSLSIHRSNGDYVCFWDELEKQFMSAYESTVKLQNLIRNEYSGDIERYLLEYSVNLCVELWWFGYKFVDDQLQRRGILSKPATMIPKYRYAVIFSFGIIVPEDPLNNENISPLELSKIAEGTTSFIGIDNEGWVWKLYKTENACTEPMCPCDKRDIFSASKHEYEISSVLHSNNWRVDAAFVKKHFIEAVLAGQGYFEMIDNGGVEISFLKMQQIKGETFSQFIFENHTQAYTANRMSSYIRTLKDFTIQGLEILEFLKKKQIVHMDFHESNGIINVSENGEKNLVLIDFGLSECYDKAVHEKDIALLKDKSYLPTIGKGRFAVSELFTAPLYVHDLQIFCTRFVENGILGMSSRLSNIFDRRRILAKHFPGFGKYLSFVKDILDSHEREETSFLVQISEALLHKSKDLSKNLAAIDSVLIDSFSHDLYLNMKVALEILRTPELIKFFNVWIQTYYVDAPEKIGITKQTAFPTSLNLLEALMNMKGDICSPNEQLSIVIQKIEKFVNITEEAFRSIKNVYSNFIDHEPEMNQKIQRITSQLLEIRRKEIQNRQNDLIRADPIPRMFVSCQGSYNPPTKAHLFLAHEGRKRALDVYSQQHPEDNGLVECNEHNIFGILSSIATFEVMEKEYPNQCFTIEERQSFLRQLTGSKSAKYVSGESPYDKYNDWSWLLFDYSGHSGGKIKNSSNFLAESETIDLIFLITFADTDIEWNLSDDIASKLQELRLDYSDYLVDIKSAYEALVDFENNLQIDLKQFNFQIIESENYKRNGLFLNEKHFRFIENVFREILIQNDRLKNKGNYRLFAISGEAKNSDNKDLYLGMADVCPRDLNVSTRSFNVSSTKIRKFMHTGEGPEALEFIDDFVAEKINLLNALFRFVGKFELNQEKRSEFAAKFFERSYLTEKRVWKLAVPELSNIPLKKTIFRESYTPLPITVSKLTMFLEFAKPEELESSPFIITGVFNLKWNRLDYPFGHVNVSNLLALDGRSDFIEIIEIKLLDMNMNLEYFVTDDKLIFNDGFIHSVLNQKEEFKFSIRAKIRPLGLNRSGRGLYLSGKQREEHIALTLMEPFGFSNMFYMQDRPDVLANYDIILLNYPHKNTLLAGGDYKNTSLHEYLLEENIRGVLEECADQPIVVVTDTHVKPTYLFQIIFLPYENEGDLKENGKLIMTTRNGVNIRLVRESISPLDDTSFALDSLKKVMAFDENFSGHVYDSNNLTLVAATDFNSGAREMRNFMVFSPSKLLANKYISTIDDFYNVERIVAHEYLHHVSGNRITMRDFFEVTLKEGLTVLRDMYFRENGGMFGKCSRIEAVTKLRKTQWVQDSGPKAHSVRPDSIEHKGDFEVSLFTTTVYEKGAEIMRMIQEIIQPDAEKFSKILSKYLSGPIRPSTIEELVDSFDLERNIPRLWFSKKQFMKWFLVKGTPTVTFNLKQNSKDTWILALEQKTVNGNDSSVEQEMMVPIRIGFFDDSGAEMTQFKIVESSGIDHLHDDLFALYKSNGSVTINFIDQTVEVVPSVNRGFSAPIKVEYACGYKAAFLAKYESDPLSRFDAFQFLLKSAIYNIYQRVPFEDLVKKIVELVKDRFSKITNSRESNVFDYWKISRSIAGMEQEKLELALSLEEMYLSNLVEDFDSELLGPVNPVELSASREAMQKMLSEELFKPGDIIGEFDFKEFDLMANPGTVKLDQVLLRTYVNSRVFADQIAQNDSNPSMERKMALLECRYRLSDGTEDRMRLLEDFNDYIMIQTDGHAVAKEKLFKFVILKSKTAQELKDVIEKFDLLVPTQPQNLKLFAKEFASNNLSVFHHEDGLKLMGDVIVNCDKFGNHETAATLIKHSFEVNLLKLDAASKARVAVQLSLMLNNSEISKKLENSVNSLLKQLVGKN